MVNSIDYGRFMMTSEGKETFVLAITSKTGQTMTDTNISFWIFLSKREIFRHFIDLITGFRL